MAKLQELGEFVRSASSTIEAPVVRKLTDALQGPGGNAGEVRCEAWRAPQGSAREARSALPGRCGTSRCPEARRPGPQAGRRSPGEQHPRGAFRAVRGPASGSEARAQARSGDSGPRRGVLGSGSGPARCPAAAGPASRGCHSRTPSCRSSGPGRMVSVTAVSVTVAVVASVATAPHVPRARAPRAPAALVRPVPVRATTPSPPVARRAWPVRRRPVPVAPRVPVAVRTVRALRVRRAAPAAPRVRRARAVPVPLRAACRVRRLPVRAVPPVVTVRTRA